MNALIAKEWDPDDWNRDIWEDPNEVEDIEPSNSASRSNPSTLSVEVNPVVPEEPVIASSEVIALQGTVDSLPYLPLSLPLLLDLKRDSGLKKPYRVRFKCNTE